MYIPHTIFVMGHLDFSFLGSEVIAVCSFALIWREVDVFCRSKTHLPVEITTMDVCSSFVSKFLLNAVLCRSSVLVGPKSACIVPLNFC